MDTKNMAKPAGAALTLGGETYELRLTHSALRRFSAVTKLGMSELETCGDRYDILSTLLWVMLRRELPTLTEAALDALIDEALDDGTLTLTGLMQAVGEAIADAFGTENAADAAEDGETPPAAAGALETL